MLVETRAYRLLSSDQALIDLMNQIRGRPFDKQGETGIFVDDIPDNFKKMTYAPFIRINPITEQANIHADDCKVSEKQSVQIDWWCKKLAQSEQLKLMIDSILEREGFVQYYSDRYRDPDIKLKMNVRKYLYEEFINKRNEED